jgi:glycosyltransferase involved in cell wall biosynthesis
MTGGGSPRLSVLIITLNEERLLDEVLESVEWAEEVVVLDSGSTDRTAEIARSRTCHFHVHAYENEGRQRNRSLQLSTGEWVLFVDGDEIVTPELRRSIEAALVDPGDAAGFRIELHTHFLGRWFGRRGWRREWKVRLFRRDRGRFAEASVHVGAIVDGPVRRLAGTILHHSNEDLEHLARKLNRYSTLMAGEMHAAGRRGSGGGAVARGIARFVRDYLLGGDFLYGGAGLIRSSMYAHYTFLKYAKLWEMSIDSGADRAEGEVAKGSRRGAAP